jgi:hypothetical protein
LVSFVRYFLSETATPTKSSNQSNDAAKAQQIAAKEVEKRKQLAEQAEKKRLAEESKRLAAEKRAADLAAKMELEEKKRREQEAKAKQAAKKREAQATVIQAKKGSTISLFGIGQGSDELTTSPVVPIKKSPTLKVKQSPSQMMQKPVAPKGMPTISGWKLNGDGTISGRITGSPNFKQGELITTSQIKNGRIESGSVVQTGSGSKYFLG